MKVEAHLLALVLLHSFFDGRFLDAQVRNNEVLTSSTTSCHSQYYKWPACADFPTGYECHCGPGYFWNTHMCISKAVNSRLEFPPPAATNGTITYAYTLLLATPFPSLHEFTLSFWVEVANAAQSGAIFSYKHGSRYNVFSMNSGPNVSVTINGDRMNTGYMLVTGTWTHIILTWSAQGGLWAFYVNGRLRSTGQGLGQSFVLPPDGDFILGQVAAATEQENVDHFLLEQSFVGSLSHFNIWGYVMNGADVASAYDDCSHTHCGTAVEWVSFRSGTRGTARLRWPSGVPGSHNCFTDRQSEETCERYCGVVYGVQCKESTESNVKWLRTAVDAVVAVPCPGQQWVERVSVMSNASMPDAAVNEKAQVSAYARRACLRTADGQGVWDSPQMSDCMSAFFKLLAEEMKLYSNAGMPDELTIMTHLKALENYTRGERLLYPIDITAAVTALKLIVESQKRKLQQEYLYGRFEPQVNMYGDLTASYDSPFDHVRFAELFMKTVSNLLSEENLHGWNATTPLAHEANKLLQGVDDFSSLIADIFRQRLRRGEIAPNEARYRFATVNIGMKIEVISRARFRGFTFPDVVDVRALGLNPFPARLVVPATVFDHIDTQIDQVALTAVRYEKVSQLLPNPNTFGTENDNLNSAVMSVSFRNEEGLINVTAPFKIEFALIKNINVSSASCFAATIGNNTVNALWNPVALSFHSKALETQLCQYVGSGIFGVTTDMYDLNWQQPEVVLELLSAPAYVGGSISALLSVLTLVLLIYVRTSSCTSLIHKHLATSVATGNLTFMIGIGLVLDESVCKAFAIVFHYFFLANFTWLMNEAFNLYYVVTYTAHNQNQAGSSGVRYYIIGWALPALAVGIVVGVYYDNYFASDMCWIDWSMIWFFVGPPLAIICVTLLVMTFAAKESTEMSYTKNEAANKLTEYHSRAVWTQIVLLTMTWAFAMAMLRFRGSVFKWVYMIFGCMQGSFFFVFYFLLNEEVRTVIKGKEIRKELGWEVTGIDDSMLFDCNDEAIPLTVKTKKEEAANEDGKRHSKRGIVRPAAVGQEVRATLANAEELDDLMVTSV